MGHRATVPMSKPDRLGGVGMTGLLEGIRVLEIGVLLAVDGLGGLLGDEGADVIKVESPMRGDYLRNIGPLMAEDWSTSHLSLNRNKRSVTIDARTAEGREILARLVATADVVITGNIGDTNRSLGLDYGTVTEIKPDIVYCQVTGFGASGPYADIPTHGKMMDALGANMVPLGLDEDGLVRPLPGDNTTGGSGVVLGPMYAAFAVTAGLSQRDRTGRGCYIDVSCADVVLAARRSSAIATLNQDKIDGETSTIDIANSAKYQYYQTKDGKYILFCCIEAKFWENFCRATEREDLLDRHKHGQAVDFAFDDKDLRHELQAIFHRKTQYEWSMIASQHDIPMGPALQLTEIAGDPHLNARGIVVEEDHPVHGRFLTIGSPIRVTGEAPTLRSAPSHGQHTDEVLISLGFTNDQVERLRRDRVI